MSSLPGGVQLGYNWERDHFKGMDVNSKTTLVAPVPAQFNAIAGNSFTLRENWDASIRGSVGCAWNNMLLYGTGGVSFLQTRFTSNVQPTIAG